MLTIDDLPDDDLLAIFGFYVVRYQYLDLRQFSDYKIKRQIESWQPLVHVCRRWRCLVFGSPRRLNLQLCCTAKTPARKLDVCPALPLLIRAHIDETSVDNVIALLKHSDRISTIDLECPSQPEKLLQVPFPELAVLCLSCSRANGPDLPGSFLGGSAPRLRDLSLNGIPFPGLPKLLLSATHLVRLRLTNVPHSGSISPETLVTCLSMLTSLETLLLEHMPFLSYHPDFRLPFPPTRSVLPSLTTFSYKGVKEYMEEIVARIDAPQLYRLSTTFFFDFKAPELAQFISRTPTLGAYDEAHLTLDSGRALVTLCRSHPEPSDHRMVEVRILCVDSKPQLSSLVRICSMSLHFLLTMENLYIHGSRSPPLIGIYHIDDTKWLDILLPFTAVKNLYLSKLFSPSIAIALDELTGGRTIEMLPDLQNVFLEGFQPSGPVDGGIARFISARQLTNRPVAISVWDRDC